MAVDIQKLFNEDLPNAISGKPDQALAIGHVYVLEITGATGGTWTIDTSKATGPSCKAGASDKSECTITVADSDFQKLYENPQANGMPLFFAGKLKVKGNQTLAMKLQKLFDLAK